MSDEVAISDIVKSPKDQDLLAWATLVLISQYRGKDMLERFKIDAFNHANTVNVEMRINGVEVSPRAVFGEIESQLDEMVKREAADLLKQKLGGLVEVQDMVHSIKQTIEREACDKLGVDWSDRW